MVIYNDRWVGVKQGRTKCLREVIGKKFNRNLANRNFRAYHQFPSMANVSSRADYKLIIGSKAEPSV